MAIAHTEKPQVKLSVTVSITTNINVKMAHKILRTSRNFSAMQYEIKNPVVLPVYSRKAEKGVEVDTPYKISKKCSMHVSKQSVAELDD